MQSRQEKNLSGLHLALNVSCKAKFGIIYIQGKKRNASLLMRRTKDAIFSAVYVPQI